MSIEIKPGDVLRYTPLGEFQPHWCREGIALVCVNGRARDTFWSTATGDRHILTGAEMDTAELVFNVAEYDETTDAGAWETFNPSDRGTITSQHGLQVRRFIRKGAAPDIETQIHNAEARLEQEEQKLRSAQFAVDWARRELDDVTAKRPAAGSHGGVS